MRESGSCLLLLLLDCVGEAVVVRESGSCLLLLLLDCVWEQKSLLLFDCEEQQLSILLLFAAVYLSVVASLPCVIMAFA